MTDDEPQSGQSVDISDAEPKPGVSASDQQAVALGYDKAEDDAPRVLASGRGAVADQIISLAFAHGVRVRKDEDLIEVLSKLEVDTVIPVEAFAAVAEILSYVYRYNALYGKPEGTHPA